METQTAAKKPNFSRAPFTMLSHGHKLILKEEISPLNSKKECKEKIRELNDGMDTEDLRAIKHKEKYFIYKRKNV